MNRTALFKYQVDIRPVGAVVLALAMSLVPFIARMPLWAFVPYMFLVFVARTYTPFAQHNQGHLPVFNSGLTNGLYNILLTQCTGYPTSLWELHHNRGHHRNFLTPEKDVARITSLSTGKVMSRWMYALRGNLTIHLDSVRIGLQERREGKRSLLPKLAFEIIMQALVTGALVWWNPWMAFWCFIVPNAVAAWFIWWESYTHHLHVPTTNTYDASVTVMSGLYNRHTFNIGHHTAHHEKPTLHWSMLPERTAQIRARMPDVCVQGDKIRSAQKQTAEMFRHFSEQLTEQVAERI